MRFRLLGPLSVTTDTGEAVDICSPKLRVLLAVLLLRANAVVSTDTLVDSIWGDRPPTSARANLKTYVSTLRRLLCPANPAGEAVGWRRQGYVIRISPDQLDVAAFERSLVAGTEADRGGDDVRAIKHLQDALAMWRGGALEDIPATTDSIATAARKIEERRLTALELLNDLQMRSGRHAELVGELEVSVAQHPLRERLWEQLMVALYRDGRQAEALAAYHRLRAHLIEEIGVEPGPGPRSLQGRILAGDPTLHGPLSRTGAAATVGVHPTPRQLPMDVATFAGRHQQLDTLRDLLKDGHSVRSRRVVVIHGPPGVGKSALAIRAANMCAPQFPDGQLYLNLHGATPGAEPVQAGEAIGRVLRALGVSASDVPPDVEESAALFRSLVAGRRLLMVLDNATTAGHLRNLLPGGSETAVIVTSRANLAALDGSVHLLLNPLSPVESEEVLRGLISDARMMSDVAAVRHLAQLCDHLPVALRIASARLNARPGWATADLVDLLSNEQHRLSELAIDDLAVRNSLSVSYSALLSSADPRDGAVARAFCLLGLFPGAFFDIHLAAALFDTSSRAAGRVLDRLVDAHLVEPLSPGRFHIRDLVRLYAAELAGGMSVEVRHAASARMLRQYLATAMCATRLAFPDRTPHPGPASAAGTSPVRFAHEVEARDWLRRECANMAAVGHRALLGDDELARLGNDLILTLRWFFQHAGHPKAAIGGTDDVVLAARRVDDPRRHPADDEQASPTADVPPMYR